MIRYKGQNIDTKSGDIVLFRNEFIWDEPMTYLSVAVRGFTKCEYNHCATVVGNGWGKLYINESIAKGVVKRTLEEHLERSKTRILILRPKLGVVEKEFCERADYMLGIKYDFSSLIFYQALYRITGVWIGRTEEAAKTDGMVCSEYVAWCHNLPKWWLYSAKELLNSELFEVVYREN